MSGRRFSDFSNIHSVAFILQMLEGMSLNMFITGCQIDRNKQKKAFAVENNFICSTD